jgi:phosphoserine phosphatase
MSDMIRLEVSVDDQRLDVFDEGRVIRSFPVSTGEKGMGFTEGSYRTPWGRFKVVEKIGVGDAVGTVFKARVPVGFWQAGEISNDDLILTRILRIEGLDDENANTLERCIYVHGTNREDLIGVPASHGCVRLSNADVIELFDLVSEGTELVIHPRTRKWGKLVFFDCDSTLSTIEGIDELGRLCGPEVHHKVVELTDAAMNGEIPIREVFSRRMEIIRPDRGICDQVADLYLATVMPGALELIRELKEAGWIPVILSGGFAPLIRPLADALGISHVEAVPLYHDEEGCYAGYGADYPTTRNLGKNEIIREWRAAMLPECVVMIGDGVSDLETMPDVDTFIGFGGVVARSKVKEGAQHWIGEIGEFGRIRDILDGIFNDPIIRSFPHV